MTHLKLIIGLVILWVVIPFFCNIWLELSNLCWFITLYIIAAYIRLYPDHFKMVCRRYLLIAFIIYFILMSIAYWIDISGFYSEFWSIYNPINHNNMQNSPFALAISVCIFLAFRRLNIGYNKIINIVAKTTFGIYLLHDHPLVRGWAYSDVFDCLGHTDSEYLIFYLFMIVFVIFISCMIIEYVRIIIVDKKILKKLDEIILKLHEKIDYVILKTINRKY